MPRNSEDLIADLVADLQPIKPLRQNTGMAFAVLALAAGGLGMLTMFGPRADLVAGRPSAMLLTGGGLFLILALASAWAVVDMAKPYVGIRRDGFGWTALMAGVLPIAALVVMVLHWWHGEAHGLERDGLVCMQYGLGWSTLTFAALVLWLRRGAPMYPERAGMLAGVAAGAAGIFAVSLFCPSNDLVHVGIWHGLTVMLTGLIGRLSVPRLIAW